MNDDITVFKDNFIPPTVIEDTIVAQATPAGKGGVAIVRVSGPKTKEVAEAILKISLESPENIPARLPNPIPVPPLQTPLPPHEQEPVQTPRPSRQPTPSPPPRSPMHRPGIRLEPNNLKPTKLEPRKAAHLPFYNSKSDIIDIGLALFFPNPNSYTGEDVLELQGHGGQVLVDMLIKEIEQLGVRLAEPGEFTKRAFLNSKIDLTQAEAIADIINATSEQSVKYAARSLQGAFSETIESIFKDLVSLRMYVEAALDFPEEEIDFMTDGKIEKDLITLQKAINTALDNTKQGVVLQEGVTVVIAGKPNAGKSSLLNALSGTDSAIVTEIPGTTRDLLKEDIYIDGIPVRFIDTAGLRESNDLVEKEGIRRAKEEIKKADYLFYISDITENEEIEVAINHVRETISDLPTTLIYNKIDLTQPIDFKEKNAGFDMLALSAKTKKGIDNLKRYLKEKITAHSTEENGFIARRRHLIALNQVSESLKTAKKQLESGQSELLAEELKLAQEALGKITGKFSSDDLLGEIFSQFCIGK